jgi:hypothetical protein
MNDKKIASGWLVATGIILAVLIIAVAALWLSTTAKAQLVKEGLPAVSIQWQPQSILETRFAAKITEDNRTIRKALLALAGKPGLSVDEMASLIGTTYLKKPRFWVDGKWEEGWTNVLPHIKKAVEGSASLSIDSVTALIEYRVRDQGRTPEEDIDAVATVRMTFSASPGGYILEGMLRHSRVCVIEP